MKFTDGYWQMRPGRIPHYAAQVHEVEIESNGMTVYAPTKKPSGRGDTINLPIITIRFSSPMENIIRVQMMLEFPTDPACNYLDLQYMLGDSLLVAPVFNTDGNVSVYVPDGRWTNLLNESVLVGPRWEQETHDFMSLPLLARPNSVIPIGNRTDRPDYDYSDDVTLWVYQLDNERLVQIEIPRLDGKIETKFTVLREGDMVYVQRQGPSKLWNVSLIGVKNVKSVETAKFQIINGSTLINAEPQTDELKIQLD